MKRLIWKRKLDALQQPTTMSSSTSSFNLRVLVDVYRACNRSRSSCNFMDGRNQSIIGVAKGFSTMCYGRPCLVKILGQKSINAVSGSGMGKDDDQLQSPPAAAEPSRSPSPPPPSSWPRKPPRPRFPAWARWVLGSLFSLVLSVWMPNLNKKSLFRIGGEAEVIVQEAENVAQVVEKVANVAENVSSNIADNIPGDGKFKEAALAVEHVSKEVAKDAQIAEQIIHKVDAVTQDLEDLEGMAEPIIRNIVGTGNSNRNKS